MDSSPAEMTSISRKPSPNPETDSDVLPQPSSTQSEIIATHRDATVLTNTSQQHEFASDEPFSPDLQSSQESNAHQLAAPSPQHINTASESISQETVGEVDPTSWMQNPTSPSHMALPHHSEFASPPNVQSLPDEPPKEGADVAEARQRPPTDSLSNAAQTQSTMPRAFDFSEVKSIIETIANSPELRKDITKLIAQSPEFTEHLDLKEFTNALIRNPESSKILKDVISQRYRMMSEQRRETHSTNTTQNEGYNFGIKVLSQETVKASTPTLGEHPRRSGHLIASLPARTLYAIEVVLKPSMASMSKVQRKRHIDHRASPAATRGGPLQDIPDRILIRSTFLLNLLQRVINETLEHGGERPSDSSRPSLVFLYPFKFFITHADKIEAEAKRLDAKFGNGGQPGKSIASAGPGGPVTNDGPTMSPADAATVVATTPEDVFESEKAFKYLKLLRELLATHLKPIFELRKGYQTGKYTSVSFQDLWLLYEVGGLVFQREPHPGYPSSIARVTHFGGGRELLNNGEFKGAEPRKDIQGANSKGLEDRFFLQLYSLDFDGETYGPVEEAFTIPPWEGTRSVYDLKAFPLNFCRNRIDHSFESLEDFRNHVVERGKKFVDLNPINHKYYNGKVVGSRHEFYNSSVVVDFKMRRQDTESRHGLLALMDLVSRSESNLSAGLTIYPGDPREVQEGSPLPKSSAECVLPGCDGNEFIHNDIRLDQNVARQKIESYGITSAKFSRRDVGHLEELDYALFPTFVHGYVLSSRAWAKLDLNLLTDISNTGSMFDTLHIPSSHKESLTGLVEMRKSRFSNHLALDIVPGKGEGLIILLHGKPGLGKTATAEAMAADLNKPLYPITYADLGNGPSEIETNLKKIFRYSQRWDCVLLLDEADVFLMPRNIEDTSRNSIVSIFLRNLEWYPGIIFLTTNRLDRFDDGVLDRVHVKLRYPGLSESFTEKIFADHFERINKLRPPADKLATGEYGAPTSYCQVKEEDKKKIQAWCKDQYAKASNAGKSWWNGRQIRNAFQLATGFAEQEMGKNEENVASIKLRHFKKVLDLHDGFSKDLIEAKNEVDDEDAAEAQIYTQQGEAS